MLAVESKRLHHTDSRIFLVTVQKVIFKKGMYEVILTEDI